MSQSTYSLLQPQKMTPGDLAFLVFNKGALRFQHAKYDAKLRDEGSIVGDAYSLSYPDAWHPANKKKAKEFEQNLTKLVERIYVGQIASADEFDGSFLLFKDVDNARWPATDRESYSGPFYSVGVGTHYYQDKEIGRVQITRDLAINKFGISRIYDPTQQAKKDSLINYLTGQLVAQIRLARKSAPDQTEAMREDQRKLSVHQRFKRLKL